MWWCSNHRSAELAADQAAWIGLSGPLNTEFCCAVWFHVVILFPRGRGARGELDVVRARKVDLLP